MPSSSIIQFSDMLVMIVSAEKLKAFGYTGDEMT